MLFSTIWTVLIVALFFGGTIFVHELGHYLAAKRRGLKIEAFSIGFGPKLFGWTNREGVEFKVSLLPLGGYVRLPQLADLSGLEGEAEQPTEKLPPLSWADKVIVSVMGAVFNVLLAIVLSCLLWAMGQNLDESELTTVIGYVPEEIEQVDIRTRERLTFPSPAYLAGLRAGDEIVRIDGRRVRNWEDVAYRIPLGTGRDEDNGVPMVQLDVEREGEPLSFTVYPFRDQIEGLREIGIAPRFRLMATLIVEGSAAERAGVLPGDVLMAFEGVPLNAGTFDLIPMLDEWGARPGLLTVEREGELVDLEVTPEFNEEARGYRLGVHLASRKVFVRQTPVAQIERGFRRVSQTLGSLVNPRSDVGLKHLSGPVGISYVFYRFRDDFTRILGFAILLNISLAILNLLPIPVLDGGHIAFATLQAIRGKPLPPQVIGVSQSVFVLLLLTLMAYVIFYDTRRVWFIENPPEAREEQEGATESLPEP